MLTWSSSTFSCILEGSRVLGDSLLGQGSKEADLGRSSRVFTNGLVLANESNKLTAVSIVVCPANGPPEPANGKLTIDCANPPSVSYRISEYLFSDT
ncbi:Hypothetical predicted protein [Pelobates cultripes]|uniref:Uncharacterized protein n=1 Tax=Pelobates cultripes TaxID=61616 RepID=A0AAD1SB52_PELCU|nr:Hypothetical predicted protein [Pelobates cultripes]